MNVNGKVALVTGSTSGIGLGIAEELAKKGCKIALNGLVKDNEGEELKQRFKTEYGVDTIFSAADLTDQNAIAQMVEETEAQLGPIDILVNNAGIQHTSPLEAFPAEKWEAMIAIMLSAPFYAMQKVMPKMRERGWGRVVNIASVHGLVASVNKAAYVAAKHGVTGLSKVAALEYAGSGVTCNYICPGWVDTPLVKSQYTAIADNEGVSVDEAKTKLVSAKQPSGTFTSPNQLGEVVLFLCSDAAGNMTGSQFTVDGGWTAQ